MNNVCELGHDVLSLTDLLPKQCTDNEQQNTGGDNILNDTFMDESTPPSNAKNHKSKAEMCLDHEQFPEKSNYKNPVNTDVLIKHKPPKICRKNRNLTLEERIENDSPSNHYVQNEIVIASIPGYAPWPARILSIQGETIIVEFFGTGQMLVAY